MNYLTQYKCFCLTMGGEMENNEYDNGWGVFKLSGGDVHVAPLFDIGEHIIDADCQCCPAQGVDGECVHNSFDGREEYEEGRRKPH